MIDVANESLLTVAQAAKAVPYGPNVCTVWRWLDKGCRGVRLESILLGGRRFTSREALERFFAATTAAGGTPDIARSPRQRQRAIEAARGEVEKDW